MGIMMMMVEFVKPSLTIEHGGKVNLSSLNSESEPH